MWREVARSLKFFLGSKCPELGREWPNGYSGSTFRTDVNVRRVFTVIDLGFYYSAEYEMNRAKKCISRAIRCNRKIAFIAYSF